MNRRADAGDALIIAFRCVFSGIETPVAESLKETTKLQNLRKDLLESVKLIQTYGIEVMSGFIVGFDNDPPDVFDRQIAFIREAALPLSMVRLRTALPNMQLWRRLRAEGRLSAGALPVAARAAQQIPAGVLEILCSVPEPPAAPL